VSIRRHPRVAPLLESTQRGLPIAAGATPAPPAADSGHRPILASTTVGPCTVAITRVFAYTPRVAGWQCGGRSFFSHPKAHMGPRAATVEKDSTGNSRRGQRCGHKSRGWSTVTRVPPIGGAQQSPARSRCSAKRGTALLSHSEGGRAVIVRPLRRPQLVARTAVSGRRLGQLSKVRGGRTSGLISVEQWQM